jgi:hypothetical protein
MSSATDSHFIGVASHVHGVVNCYVCSVVSYVCKQRCLLRLSTALSATSVSSINCYVYLQQCYQLPLLLTAVLSTATSVNSSVVCYVRRMQCYQLPPLSTAVLSTATAVNSSGVNCHVCQQQCCLPSLSTTLMQWLSVANDMACNADALVVHR